MSCNSQESREVCSRLVCVILLLLSQMNWKIWFIKSQNYSPKSNSNKDNCFLGPKGLCHSSTSVIYHRVLENGNDNDTVVIILFFLHLKMSRWRYLLSPCTYYHMPFVSWGELLCVFNSFSLQHFCVYICSSLSPWTSHILIGTHTHTDTLYMLTKPHTHSHLHADTHSLSPLPLSCVMRRFSAERALWQALGSDVWAAGSSVAYGGSADWHRQGEKAPCMGLPLSSPTPPFTNLLAHTLHHSPSASWQCML